MLQTVDQRTVNDNLDQMIVECKENGARVILAGMLSFPRDSPDICLLV